MSIDFASAVVRWAQKVHNVRVAELGTSLLHYTSVPACLAILESQSIWFGEFRAMNDPQEVKFGVEFLRRWFESVIEDQTRHDQIRRFMSVLVNELDNFVDEYSGLFICCLSGSGDRLYHWRSYGDDGKGVAIEFDKSALLALPVQNQDINFLLTPVVYDEKDCSTLIEYLEDALAANCDEFHNWEMLHGVDEHQLGLHARNALASLALVPLLLKSGDYRVESEWRLIASPSIRGRRAVATHSVGSRQVRHLAVPLQMLTGCADPVVSRILLGPAVKREDFEALYRPIRDRTGHRKPNYHETTIKYVPRVAP